MTDRAATDAMQHQEHASRPARLTRREWTLVALGLGVWLAIAFGGAWLVHQLTRSPGSCGARIEARTFQREATGAGPRNALQLLTGAGPCR